MPTDNPLGYCGWKEYCNARNCFCHKMFATAPPFSPFPQDQCWRRVTLSYGHHVFQHWSWGGGAGGGGRCQLFLRFWISLALSIFQFLWIVNLFPIVMLLFFLMSLLLYFSFFSSLCFSDFDFFDFFEYSKSLQYSFHLLTKRQFELGSTRRISEGVGTFFLISKRLQYFFLHQYPRGLSVGIRKATCQK